MKGIGLVVALGLLTGCSSVMYRTVPDYQTRSLGIRTVALMPLDVKIYRLPANGKREFVEEWSQQARENLVRSISKRLGTDKRLVLAEFDEVQLRRVHQEYADIPPLFQAVALSVVAHTYNLSGGVPDPTFQTKRERFDYTLGPLPALGDAAGADALLFVYAFDEISTFGRHAWRFIAAIWGTAAGAGAYMRGAIPFAETMIAAALVDPRTGDILWFSMRHSQVRDLRKPSSAESLVSEVFEDLAASRRR